MDSFLLQYPLPDADIRFMRTYLHEDIAACMLKGKFSTHERQLLKQVHLRQRLEKKIPTIYADLNWILPEQLNIEQSSSEKTARYKASLLRGAHLLDLTLGMGIDTLFLSECFFQVDAIEQDAQLAELSQFNLNLVRKKDHIQVHVGKNAERFLEETKHNFDLIYVDPDRRSGKGSKLVQLQDCSPNVIALMPLLERKARNLLIKTSPLLDIQQALSVLPHVKTCHILETDKECKELLFHIDFSYQGVPELKAINLDNHKSLTSSLAVEYEMNIDYSVPLDYLYEPSACFLKSGLFKTIAKETNTTKLHPNSHLYTSKELLPDFPGRCFHMLHTLKPNATALKSHLPSLQANLTLRNYPSQTKDLAKKLKIKEGGDDYLFATTLLNDDKVLLLGKKIY
jgi:16S rRNA G966 N2-methylase RsmD